VDAASGFDAWALTLAVFLPAIGALVMMAVPRAREFELKTIALGASLASLAVGVYLLFAFDYSDAKSLQVVEGTSNVQKLIISGIACGHAPNR